MKELLLIQTELSWVTIMMITMRKSELDAELGTSLCIWIMNCHENLDLRILDSPWPTLLTRQAKPALKLLSAAAPAEPFLRIFVIEVHFIYFLWLRTKAKANQFLHLSPCSQQLPCTNTSVGQACASDPADCIFRWGTFQFHLLSHLIHHKSYQCLCHHKRGSSRHRWLVRVTRWNMTPWQHKWQHKWQHSLFWIKATI